MIAPMHNAMRYGDALFALKLSLKNSFQYPQRGRQAVLSALHRERLFMRRTAALPRHEGLASGLQSLDVAAEYRG